MFANALKSASIYTKPVITSLRYYDGTVESGCAAFIVLNEEGWILTAAHIFIPLFNFNQQKSEILEYEKKISEINLNPYNAKKKKKLIRKLPFNKKWIINVSSLWGPFGDKADDIKFNPVLDLGIARLKNFNKDLLSKYPIFKNPQDELLVGTSLCKLGYPFHQIESTFDEKEKQFSLKEGTFPLARFPLDGMFTRNIIYFDNSSKKNVKFIETSTPGLKGQSGGPIFDVNGYIWGLQSRTTHFSLGFNPKIKKDKKEVEEHQFLSAGVGTHVEEIVNFLTENNIKFNLSAAS
jgi:trypsin-like peptidase